MLSRRNRNTKQILALPWNKSQGDTDAWKEECTASQGLAEAHDKNEPKSRQGALKRQGPGKPHGPFTS